MSGVQVLVIALAAMNVGLAMALADRMTWRTHRWGPQLLVMGCGLVASGCGWLGWAGVDLEFALCAQFVVLVVLLHCSERLRLMAQEPWRDRGLAEMPARTERRG